MVEFMEILLNLPKINSIVSDVVLSKDAEKFWLKLIFNKKYKMSFFDYKDKELISKKEYSKEEINNFFYNNNYRVGLIK